MTKSTSSNTRPSPRWRAVRVGSTLAAVSRFITWLANSRPKAISAVRSSLQSGHSSPRSARSVARLPMAHSAPRPGSVDRHVDELEAGVLGEGLGRRAHARLDLGPHDAPSRGSGDHDPLAPQRRRGACRGRAPSRRCAGASTGRGGRSRSTRRTSGRRRARTGPGSRARRSSGRSRVGPPGDASGGALHADQAVEAGRDADRAAAVAAAGDGDEAAGDRGGRLPPDEPPAVRPCCHGLWVTPLSLVTLTLSPPNSDAVV